MSGKPEKLALTRTLRRKAPNTERLLWEMLRARRLDGLKFRRQFAIGRYVVDFVRLEHRLIVEADGPLHDPIRDVTRDDWLGRRGFRVVRLDNARINDHPELALDDIRKVLGMTPSLIGPLADDS